MNSAASDWRNQVLVNAFVEREPDERMKRLYDEIVGAKESMIDTWRGVGDEFLPKRVLYLKNLMTRVEERLTRRDLGDRSVVIWERNLMDAMVKDLEQDYYYHQGLKRKSEDQFKSLTKPPSKGTPSKLARAAEEEFDKEEVELVYILALRYLEIICY